MKERITCPVCRLEPEPRRRVEQVLLGDPGDPTADPPVAPVAALSLRKAQAWTKETLGTEIHFLALRQHRIEHLGKPAKIRPLTVRENQQQAMEGLNTLDLAPAPPSPPPAARAPAPVVPGAVPDGEAAPPEVPEPLPPPAEVVPEVQAEPWQVEVEAPEVDPGDERVAKPGRPPQKRMVINLKGIPREAETSITELLTEAANGVGRVKRADAGALDAWTTEYFRLITRLKTRRARAKEKKDEGAAFEAEVAMGQVLLHGGHQLAQVVKARRIVTGGAPLSGRLRGAMAEHEDASGGVKGLIGQLGERPPDIDGDEPDAPEEEAEIARGYPEEQTTAPVETHGVASLDDLPEEEPTGMDVVAIAERGREDEPVMVPVDPGEEAAAGAMGDPAVDAVAAPELPAEALAPTGTGDYQPPRKPFVWRPPPRPRNPV